MPSRKHIDWRIRCLTILLILWIISDDVGRAAADSFRLQVRSLSKFQLLRMELFHDGSFAPLVF